MVTQTFAEALKIKLREQGLRASELSRRTGISRQNISRILNEIPHPITGAPAATTQDAVTKIATALNWDLNEALPLAGFAPPEQLDPYQREIANLFRCSQNWSEPKRQKVLSHIQGLIEILDEQA